MNILPVDIACLCAEWCDLCAQYKAVIAQISAEFAQDAPATRWHWIDIEDEADLLGDVDIETFPTIVIVDPDSVRFAGPLTPQAETLRRLLRATVFEAPPDARWPAAATEFVAFAAALRSRTTNA